MKYITIAQILAKTSIHVLICAPVPVTSQSKDCWGAKLDPPSVLLMCASLKTLQQKQRFVRSAGKQEWCWINYFKFQSFLTRTDHFAQPLCGEERRTLPDLVRSESDSEYLRVAGTVLVTRWAGIRWSWCGWRRWRGRREVPFCWVLGWVLSSEALPAHWARVMLLATRIKWIFFI